MLSLISSIGALQGGILLLSILLKFRHRKNLPMALLLIVFSIRLATIPTWNRNIMSEYPWLYPTTAPLPFLFGPLLWWCVREMVDNTTKIPRRLYLHFLPYLMEVLAVVVTLLSMNSAEYNSFLNSVFSGHPPLWMTVRNALKVLLNSVYIVLAGKIAFGKKVKRLSPAKRVWIRSLIILPSIVLLSFSYVALFPFATERLAEGAGTPFFILSVTMAVLIYTVTFLLILAPEGYQSGRGSRGAGNDRFYSAEECERLVGFIEKRFSEGAYQDPGLSLADLAAELKIHPNRLSYAVNHCRHVSFRELLNSRRLAYFSERIEEGAHQHQSLLEIAFEAGFPSKSTFNRVYKEKKGISPTEYMRKKKLS